MKKSGQSRATAPNVEGWTARAIRQPTIACAPMNSGAGRRISTSRPLRTAAAASEPSSSAAGRRKNSSPPTSSAESATSPAHWAAVLTRAVTGTRFSRQDWRDYQSSAACPLAPSSGRSSGRARSRAWGLRHAEEERAGRADGPGGAHPTGFGRRRRHGSVLRLADKQQELRTEPRCDGRHGDGANGVLTHSADTTGEGGTCSVQTTTGVSTPRPPGATRALRPFSKTPRWLPQLLRVRSYFPSFSRNLWRP